MPRLALMKTSWPERSRKGFVSSPIRFWATMAASLLSCTSSRRMTNSSPPSRARVSTERRCLARRWASACSSSSLASRADDLAQFELATIGQCMRGRRHARVEQELADVLAAGTRRFLQQTLDRAARANVDAFGFGKILGAPDKPRSIVDVAILMSGPCPDEPAIRGPGRRGESAGDRRAVGPVLLPEPGSGRKNPSPRWLGFRALVEVGGIEPPSGSPTQSGLHA